MWNCCYPISNLFSCFWIALSDCLIPFNLNLFIGPLYLSSSRLENPCMCLMPYKDPPSLVALCPAEYRYLPIHLALSAQDRVFTKCPSCEIYYHQNKGEGRRVKGWKNGKGNGEGVKWVEGKGKETKGRNGKRKRRNGKRKKREGERRKRMGR